MFIWRAMVKPYIEAEKLLNLPKNYTAKDVNDSFKKLALMHHPDKNNGILT